jgi:amino acid transporter
MCVGLALYLLGLSQMLPCTCSAVSLGYGLYYGGPAACVWGWLLATLFTLPELLCMAEFASAYPTSGGTYYWIHAVAPPKWGPVLCWVAGRTLPGSCIGTCHWIHAVAWGPVLCWVAGRTLHVAYRTCM